MKREIDLVRQQHAALGMPMRDSLGTDAGHEELLARRRAVREQTDRLIEHGLFSNNPVALASELALTMTAVASSCVQLGMEPTLNDMVNAARELIEDARIPFDKGLQSREWEQAAIGCAMLEIVCHGVASLLNIPLAKVFGVFHEAFVAGCEPDFERVAGLLRTAGYKLEGDES